jgi:hypothetical protein
MIIELVRKSETILDIGCGPNGSHWYPSVPEETEIIALDLFYAPTITHQKFSLYRMDAIELDRCDIEARRVRSQLLTLFGLYDKSVKNEFWGD